ncbi:Metalloreductase STEAP2 [Frankliniella fusca]|uniref:Metalloreductase STEAP2 n=1 Tax=Frankliniella fusca TaxID=407009 RepID=A0AAE1HVQ1_9NEOP|nr:Metalloreductase STEAP2 [Frankliniella fusca]
MKPEYFDNLSISVDAVALLNKSSISPDDLKEADVKLKSFCCDFEKLYGPRHMSSNIHLLRHLAASVRQTGNLFVSSCFIFEDLNGKLANLTHGTRHATMQIFSNFSVLTQLPLHISKLTSNDAKVYCESLSNPHINFGSCERISSGTYVVGNFDITHSCSEYLEHIFPDPLSIRTFSRLYKEKQLFVSETYQLGSRESSYCSYLSSDNVQVQGKILTFVKSMNNGAEYLAVICRSLSAPTPFSR